MVLYQKKLTINHIPQVELMVKHLRVNAHNNWPYFEKMEPIKAQLRWQTKTNSIDKGVIMMRNMEVYMGEDDGAWETGLYKESTKQKNQLKNLRTKYVSKILRSPINEHKGSISRDVLAYMSMKATAHHRKRRDR